jgi:putative tricarboxylic transport membrane protein
LFGALALLLVAPPLARISLMFGPPEMFMLAVFGLTIVVSLTANSITKGAISCIIGLFIGIIGMDPQIGFPRYVFGNSNLLGGVGFLPALIGLFSASQVFTLIQEGSDKILEVNTSVVKDAKPTLRDMVMYPMTYLRSSIIGIIVGITPAAGASIAAFIGYNEGKKMVKDSRRVRERDAERAWLPPRPQIARAWAARWFQR